MILKNRIQKVAAFLLAAILCMGGVLIPCAAETEQSPVSHGLSVLSARTDVALSSMVGNDIVFDANALAKGMNLSSVRYITVKSTPSVTDGELLLGSSKVVEGQTIPAEHFPNLVFHPATEKACRSAFTFTANGGATPMICTLYLLNEKNSTPTVSMASSLSLSVNTYRDIAAHGTLSAYDPDGDAMVFEIVKYPQNGSVRLTDATRGTYVYRPFGGYTGSDSFTYVARDLYGNYSTTATVSLQVAQSGTSVVYVDMEGSKACAAATAVTEKGIMSGVQIGKDYYFHPDRTVSRIEFLVMAMNAAGINEVPDCTATAFADDSDIPETMKGYVATAMTLGYISGKEVNGALSFLPNEEITRAEAAVMLGNLLDPEAARVIPVFADHSEIPVWAADAIFSLYSIGVMTPTDGYIAPTEALTRSEAALMLSKVMQYSEM